MKNIEKSLLDLIKTWGPVTFQHESRIIIITSTVPDIKKKLEEINANYKGKGFSPWNTVYQIKENILVFLERNINIHKDSFDYKDNKVSVRVEAVSDEVFETLIN